MREVHPEWRGGAHRRARQALRKRSRARRRRSRVAAGEGFGLVGANGAGKTTLIRCLLDLAACDAGTIEIFGVPATQPASAPAVLSAGALQPPHYLRGEEFLRAMLALAGERYDAARAGALLDELELDRDALERPVRRLSKGMTQKLGLAACFLVPRDLYLLDEPMSGLDPAARVAVKSVLRRLLAEGRTLFFTSHVLADVEELCESLGGARSRPAALSAAVPRRCARSTRSRAGNSLHEMHP
jgi:ABC-2 type transport system ATP-binding protein